MQHITREFIYDTTIILFVLLLSVLMIYKAPIPLFLGVLTVLMILVFNKRALMHFWGEWEVERAIQRAKQSAPTRRKQ